MKKWLLVLPWVVAVSTTSFYGKKAYEIRFDKYALFTCVPGDEPGIRCDWEQDFVDAMNDAHEKRQIAEYDAAYRKMHKGCFKSDCNECCPAGQGGGYICTTMACINRGVGAW